MKYKKMIDRKIFVACTDVEKMRQVINFLRYKNFDRGTGEFYWKRIFVGMSIYLTTGSKCGLMHACNTGILNNNGFDSITDLEFLQHNKLTLLEKCSGKPFGYIEVQDINK